MILLEKLVKKVVNNLSTKDSTIIFEKIFYFVEKFPFIQTVRKILTANPKKFTKASSTIVTTLTNGLATKQNCQFGNGFCEKD